jgi:general secretion pathway protein G
VLSIIALLLTLAVPRYFHSIDTSKEAVLSENLRIVRETIDKFYGDKGRYPESLEELVSERYLRALPHDPVTGSTSTWTIIAPETPGRQGKRLRHQERRSRHHQGWQALCRSVAMLAIPCRTTSPARTVVALRPASPTWR